MSDTKKELYEQSKTIVTIKKAAAATIKWTGEALYKVLKAITNPKLNNWAKENMEGFWEILLAIFLICFISIVLYAFGRGFVYNFLLQDRVDLGYETRYSSLNHDKEKPWIVRKVWRYDDDVIAGKFSTNKQAIEFIKEMKSLNSEKTTTEVEVKTEIP